MLDLVTIRRPDTPALDDDTLLITRTFTDVYSGKAFIVPEGSPYNTTLGGAQVADTRFEVAVPASSAVVHPNDEVTCDASQWNPDMVGIVFLVIGEIESTFFTHRRLTCFKIQDAS